MGRWFPFGHALALAGVLAMAPERSLVEARVIPEAVRLEVIRATCAPNRAAPRGFRRLAAGLGASLAWNLADLPRRHARWPEPIGAFTPGAAFGAHLGGPATRDGDAIGALIHRWNTLYPPYALEGTNDH